ncbi:hypothetical protein RJ639_041856 [Escallonia herrerae]|uniref:Uncharacterized protein n=1 Tax=Escallonia herrerae TaxID=1293975 RepID=A0AA89BB94_9ASTE|nr:hypothetical protein RJ639_041856 [Escallonia herrerae]
MEAVVGKYIVDLERGSETELGDCRNRCLEFEERSKRAEERCAALESEVQKKKSEFESLESRFEELELEKLAIEAELGVLKKRNVELEEQKIGKKVVSEGEKGMEVVVDLTGEKDEADRVFELMLENKVLDYEKKKAESEVEVWKAKCKELESRLIELEGSSLLRGGVCPLAGNSVGGSGVPVQGSKDGSEVAASSARLHLEAGMADSDNGIEHLQASGTPPIDTPCKQAIHVEGGKKGVLSVNESDHGSQVTKQLAGTDLDNGKQVRKKLAFGEGSPNKKIAPSTPGGVRPDSVGLVDISDSDGEPYTTTLQMPTLKIQGNKVASVSSGCALRGTLFKTDTASDDNLKRTLVDLSDEEDMGGYKGSSPFTSTPKRKRASNIVNTDSESDDDNAPICKLKNKHLQDSNADACLNNCPVTAVSGDEVRKTVSRRRLRKLRKVEIKNEPERCSPNVDEDDGPESEGESLGGFIVDSSDVSDSDVDELEDLSDDDTEFNNSAVNSTVFGDEGRKSVSRRHLMTLRKSQLKSEPERSSPRPNEVLKDDEVEDDESDSDSESLGGFIVNSSHVSESGDHSGESEDVSDDNIVFKDIISSFQRRRHRTSKWELEGEMLADFGKDPELCMKAVCALYRQQTSDEQSSKGTIHSNQRGFSQCDALRGSMLAEFLTDGDPHGDLKKSVEELQQYNSKGVELCRTLATHYSKQLFEIYKNKEDPLFLPS